VTPSDSARESLSRIADACGVPVDRLGLLTTAGGPQPDQSVLNFERWLNATSSPALQLENALAAPETLQNLLTLLGASQAVSDVLIQNPELAHLILEPAGSSEFNKSDAQNEGRALLSGATSPSHALDRLRFLKQRWTVPIVVHDLFGPWTQEQVWQALSDLADVLIDLTIEAITSLPANEGLELGVVAFGKLGGHELNYSSDVDLVYVANEGLTEDQDRQLLRYAEAFGRALSDRTGRGSLYRVDLRLRPYGSAGPLTPTMDAIEAYYARYAEPWEVQALLRSRVVSGSQLLKDRWEAMRVATCFKVQLGEPALEEMVAMRTRIEEYAEPEDLKRGSGGIRDVEFLVQLVQLLHGHAEPELRVQSTLQAIRSLDRHNILDHAVCQSLTEGYIFLRKLEHRCQLLGDQQTHTLPTDPQALNSVARLMGFKAVPELISALGTHRRTLATLYTSFLRQGDDSSPSAGTYNSLRERLGPAGVSWFDSLPQGEDFLSSLAENESSMARVERIIRFAPALVSKFKRSIPLTELLLSGEIEEDFDGVATVNALPPEVSLDRLADTLLTLHTKTVAQWALNPTENLGEKLTELTDALLRHACKRLYVDADLLALGSYGREEMAPDSDLDLVWLVSDGKRQPIAEGVAQALIALLGKLRRLDLPVEVDLRLRPDGGQGLLVRSYEALKSYDLEGMELWERFALGQARQVIGNPEAAAVVRSVAYGLPLTPERLGELVSMKRRIETERVRPQHKFRDVKLGRGGLSDIEWFVHLHEMRYPTALDAGSLIRMPERIRVMARAALINAVECEELLEAQAHLLRTRTWLVLQGIEEGVMPENPDKLDRLALAMDYADGNSFLARHEAIIQRVRQIYEDGLARLRG
jgi:glutamate-ammonia-ligase adenylyltransferase